MPVLLAGIAVVALSSASQATGYRLPAAGSDLKPQVSSLKPIRVILRGGVVETDTRYVRLAQVAAIEGGEPRAEAAASALVLLTLDAPEGFVTRDLVRQRLAATGMHAQVTGAEHATVRLRDGASGTDTLPLRENPCLSPQPSDALEVLRGALKTSSAAVPANALLRLETMNAWNNEGAVKAEVLRDVRVLSAGGNGGLRWLRFAAQDAAGRPVHGWARFAVEERRRAVTASAAIKRGELLGAHNLQLAEVTAPAGRFDGFEALERLAGRRALRDMRPGELLSASDVERRLAVRRGADVNVQVTGSGFELADRARALADGEAGEVIRVRHPRSGAVFAARVFAAHTVVPVD